jgi:hypothetical protein
MKIRPVGAELFHTDGGTDEDTMKLRVTFRKIWKDIYKWHQNWQDRLERMDRNRLQKLAFQ